MKTRKGARRQFSREFKLAAIQQVARGQKQAEVSRDLKIQTKLLAKWRQQFRSGGATALKGVGRPRGSKKTMLEKGDGSRIWELERVIGRQQMEIRFLEQALRRVEERRHRKNENGGAASSK
jgi:transposase